MSSLKAAPLAARELGTRHRMDDRPWRRSPPRQRQGSATPCVPGATPSRLSMRGLVQATGGKAASTTRVAATPGRARLVPAAPVTEKCNEVVTFLAKVDLLQYAEPLLANGFDDMEVLLEIADEDMADMGMPRGHMIKLRKRLRELAEEEASLQAQVSLPVNAAARHVARPTSQEASSVQVSWDRVRALGSDVVGGMLYKNLFDMAPDAINLFPREVRAKYQSWTVDEGAGDGDLNNSHALSTLFGKVIDAVGSSIAGMHNTDAIVPRLRQLGMRHLNYRGVSEAHFPILEKALMHTLRACLGELFTPEVEFAWSTVYKFLSSIMIEGLREAKAIAAQAEELSSKGGKSSTTVSLRTLSDAASTPGSSSCSDA